MCIYTLNKQSTWLQYSLSNRNLDVLCYNFGIYGYGVSLVCRSSCMVIKSCPSYVGSCKGWQEDLQVLCVHELVIIDEGLWCV